MHYGKKYARKLISSEIISRLKYARPVIMICRTFIFVQVVACCAVSVTASCFGKFM